MELNDVPQDNSQIFRGQKKVIYATQNGHYQASTSSGWTTEEFATNQAVAELDLQAQQAYEQVKQGEKSPLYYYMFYYRFDVASLAQATGLWRWRIQRHFRPHIFQKLPPRILKRYAQVFHLPITQLQQLPK